MRRRRAKHVATLSGMRRAPPERQGRATESRRHQEAISCPSASAVRGRLRGARPGDAQARHAGRDEADPDRGLAARVSAATSPWVLIGLTVFAISALAWLTTLSKVPLSVAYPFNALGYLGILTASVLVLHERASVWTWVGTTLVVSGLVVVVMARP